jgi:hypothetical protein
VDSGLDAGRSCRWSRSRARAWSILVGRARPAEAFAHVDWGLLVFFSGCSS